MRLLAVIVALGLGSPQAADEPPTTEDSLAEPSVDLDRAYTGVAAVERPEGEYGELPPRWWAGEREKQAEEPEPPRDVGDDLFVDPNAPIGADAPVDPSHSGATRPDVEIDPLHLLAEENPPDGRGLLIVSGVFGGLSALSALAVAVLAHSHVACLHDESSLALVPCNEQVLAHRGAVLLSTGLLAAGLPFLAAGGVAHGRHITRENKRPALEADKIRRRRTAAGVGLGVGAGLLGTALGVVAPVLAGRCAPGCSARAISSQVLWWTGAVTLGVGVGLAAYTYGRTHPARPKRIRLSAAVAPGNVALGLSGRF